MKYRPISDAVINGHVMCTNSHTTNRSQTLLESQHGWLCHHTTVSITQIAI